MKYDIEKHVVRAVELKQLPRFLYKYRPCNSRTDSIIKDSKLWFSRSKEFNDPFDCNLSETNSHRLKDYKNFISRSGALTNEQFKTIVKVVKKDPKFLLNTALEIREKTLNDHGLLSLSKNHDNILMWSHYSSSHKGIVIALDILKDPKFFSMLLIVQYQNTYKKLNIYTETFKDEKYIHRILATKAKLWEYEEEVRVLKKPHGLHAINRNAISKIYFGCSTPPEEISRFKKLCKSSNMGHIKFYKGSIVNGAFKLTFSKIT